MLAFRFLLESCLKQAIYFEECEGMVILMVN